jgi:hypothetical protein
MFENVIKVTQFRMDIVDSLYKDRCIFNNKASNLLDVEALWTVTSACSVLSIH